MACIRTIGSTSQSIHKLTHSPTPRFTHLRYKVRSKRAKSERGRGGPRQNVAVRLTRDRRHCFCHSPGPQSPPPGHEHCTYHSSTSEKVTAPPPFASSTCPCKPRKWNPQCRTVFARVFTSAGVTPPKVLTWTKCQLSNKFQELALRDEYCLLVTSGSQPRLSGNEVRKRFFLERPWSHDKKRRAKFVTFLDPDEKSAYNRLVSRLLSSSGDKKFDNVPDGVTTFPANDDVDHELHVWTFDNTPDGDAKSSLSWLCGLLRRQWTH